MLICICGYDGRAKALPFFVLENLKYPRILSVERFLLGQISPNMAKNIKRLKKENTER